MAALLMLYAGTAGAQSPSLIGLPQSSLPACAAGEYWQSVDSVSLKWKKCSNGTITDLDTVGGSGSGTELDQPSGSDFRPTTALDNYYLDVNGNGARATDGTEPFVDFLTVEVPRDYATVQAAIDSNDCKKGSTTANQGCRIVVAPGTYAEVFEIGSTGTTIADYQNSIVVEGAGFQGAPWTAGGNQSCVVTFTGNNVANHDTISINGSIGWAIRNICIDMDASATNDTRFGIAVGSHGAVTKHGVIENVSIVDQGIAGGAGIRIGDGSVSDVAFNTIRDVYMRGVRKCIESTSTQAVGNKAENVSCSVPTDSIGGVSVVTGQLVLRDMYFASGADNQTLVQIGSEAYNSDIYNPTFEIYNDNVTFVKYANDASSGNYRVHNILGGRFQPITIPTTNHICIDWNRRGQLNVSGVSFESSTSASRNCIVNLANPHATQASEVNWISNDVVWGAGSGGITQPAMTINESSAGGPLRIHRVEQGSVNIGQGGSLVFEGSALDNNETTVTVTNPTADRTVTIPDANSATVQAATCGGTDKVSAVNASGVVTCSPDIGGAGGSMASDTLWDAKGDLAVATGADAATRLAIGTTGAPLVVSGGTAVWGDFIVDFASGDTSTDGFLDVAAGGTGVGTLTDNGVLIGNAAGDLVATAALTNGQIVVGVTGADPAPVTLSGDATLATGGALTVSVATSLRANGANCAANQYPLGVDASGVIESCTADDDVPDAGDFGAATDLDSNGAVKANAVALGTDTTNNYVATIADSGSGEVTVTNSGSENAAVTIAIASSITRDSELLAHTNSTSAPVNGTNGCAIGDTWTNYSAHKQYVCQTAGTPAGSIWYGTQLVASP